MKKQKSHAFGKDVYLLGQNIHGEYLWLEAARWDCNGYWDFGYVETYTFPNKKNPELSFDIETHSHFDALTQNVNHINVHPDILKTTLYYDESWKLQDLMSSFYVLQEVAELYHRGYSDLYRPDLDLKNAAQEKQINEVELPAIFEAVYKLLSP